ncbi:MAG TPA: DUF1593 domain-containing protein [Pseudosphingobacterium sp.]|nr:DUF1593 domain-containing protein [Pseudosphingobacterium sp.]
MLKRCFFGALLLIAMQRAIAAPIIENDDIQLKPRIVILTDIAPAHIEPDDMESMIRLLAHADLYEIEALIATGGWNNSDRSYPSNWIDSLKITIEAYEKDLPNLMKRSGQSNFLSFEKESEYQKMGYWPSADYLKSRIMFGSLDLGYARIGNDNNSAGSDFIIKLAEEDDKRPVWVLVWGGGNTLAQAIWKVKQQRSEAEVKKFLHKLRVYTITDQDVPIKEAKNYTFSSHQWMRKECGKDLYFIWDESAWLSQNSIGSSRWKEYAAQIQGHGNLGKIYPKYKWGVEGDTPSFLHVMPTGLNDPSVYNQAGWGGYFEWAMSMDGKTSCFTNSSSSTKEISKKYENYFYPAIFANFAARMDWAKDGKGNRNPAITVNNKDGMDILYMHPKAGKKVVLDASKSIDPDGDSLHYKWWILPEAGTYKNEIAILNADTDQTTIMVPDDAVGKTFHVICEVLDSGIPGLTSYRRIIFEPYK